MKIQLTVNTEGQSVHKRMVMRNEQIDKENAVLYTRKRDKTLFHFDS